MKTNLLSKFAATLSLAACLTSLDASARTPVPCNTAIASLMNGGWINVIGTRVTARGEMGFSGFTMQDAYQLERQPLHTVDAGRRSTINLFPNLSASTFSGHFHEVFPGRGNGDEDRWVLRVKRSGVYLQSITWNGASTVLPNTVCYSGPGHQVVITGHIDNPGFGTDYWTFVMISGFLI